MIAHVVTGSPVPVAVQWLAAAALFGGALAALTLPSRGLRRLAIVISVCGFVGTVTTWVVAAVQPGRPPYSLRIVAPAPGERVAPLVTITVCGVRGDGTMTPATDPQHFLVVFIDGKEVPTVDVWHVRESLPLGAHQIRVQLVTPTHHAFNPPASASVTVQVASDAPMSQPAAC